MQDGTAGKARRTPGSEEQRHGIKIVLTIMVVLLKQYLQRGVCGANVYTDVG